MRLSLLKSATMPNPYADQGKHEFTYGCMCHDAVGFEEVNRQAAILNNPPEWIAGTEANAIEKLNISPLILEGTGAIVSAIKRSDDGNTVIVRVYQSERRVSRMSCHLNGELGSICGLINEIAEDVDQHLAMEALEPVEIRSLRFHGKCNA